MLCDCQFTGRQGGEIQRDPRKSAIDTEASVQRRVTGGAEATEEVRWLGKAHRKDLGVEF
jgi:hypothetical protein